MDPFLCFPHEADFGRTETPIYLPWSSPLFDSARAASNVCIGSFGHLEAGCRRISLPFPDGGCAGPVLHCCAERMTFVLVVFPRLIRNRKRRDWQGHLFGSVGYWPVWPWNTDAASDRPLFPYSSVSPSITGFIRCVWPVCACTVLRVHWSCRSPPSLLRCGFLLFF